MRFNKLKPTCLTNQPHCRSCCVVRIRNRTIWSSLAQNELYARRLVCAITNKILRKISVVSKKHVGMRRMGEREIFNFKRHGWHVPMLLLFVNFSVNWLFAVVCTTKPSYVGLRDCTKCTLHWTSRSHRPEGQVITGRSFINVFTYWRSSTTRLKWHQFGFGMVIINYT